MRGWGVVETSSRTDNQESERTRFSRDLISGRAGDPLRGYQSILAATGQSCPHVPGP